MRESGIPDERSNVQKRQPIESIPAEVRSPRIDPSTSALDMVGRFGAWMNGSLKAAARAMIDAQLHPDSLLRITCATVEEGQDVIRYLVHAADINGYADLDRPMGDGPGGWPVFELKNGSGIQIVIGPPSSGAVSP
jgi:hypothetical protein